MSKTRYLVTWNDWSAAKAQAVKNGMPAIGEVPDYVDMGQFNNYVEFATFDEAVTFALKKHPDDSYGCPRVTREELVDDEFPYWEADAAWEVLPSEPSPVEANPDIDYELAA